MTKVGAGPRGAVILQAEKCLSLGSVSTILFSGFCLMGVEAGLDRELAAKTWLSWKSEF